MKNLLVALVFVLCLSAVPAMAQDCCHATPVRNAVHGTACVVKHAVNFVFPCHKARVEARRARRCCRIKARQCCN